MAPRSENSVHKVGTAEAARFLADPRGHQLLIACAGQPRTVTELEEALGLKTLPVWRLVQRALGHGLLRVAETRPRAGRAIQLYQAVAPAFRVPDALLPQKAGDRLAGELRLALAADQARIGVSHLFSADPDGKPRVQPETAEGRPVTSFEAWRVLRLDPADVRALQADLALLMGRYAARQRPGTPEMLVHAAVARRR